MTRSDSLRASLLASTRILGPLLVIWLATLCAGLSPTAVWADVALDDYNLAVGLYKQGRWQDAQEQLQRFITDYPKHERLPTARLYLGLALVHSEQFESARRLLREFVQDYPRNANIAQARFRIGECSYLLDDFRSAAGELEAYLAAHPQDNLVARGWSYLGETRLRLNEPGSAADAFRQSLDIEPNGDLADDNLFGWARALELKGDTGGASERYRQLGKANSPRAADALFHLAAIEFDQQDFAAAVRSYRELEQRFAKSPLVPAARLNAGYALYQSGDFAAAEAQFARLETPDNSSLTPSYWKGLSQKSQARYPQAIETFRQALATAAARNALDQPPAESLQYQLALTFRLAGQPGPAEQAFADLVTKWPQGEFKPDGLLGRAECLIELGQLDPAVAQLEQLNRDHLDGRGRFDGQAELLRGRIDLQRAQGQSKDAAQPLLRSAGEHFERALQFSGTPRRKAEARYYLSLAAQLAGDHQRSLEVVEQLLEQASSNQELADFFEALVVRAESQLALKRWSAARDSVADYQRLFAKGRQSPRALAVAALASAGLEDWTAAEAARLRLVAEYPQGTLPAMTTLQLAEFAESKQAWVPAENWFAALIPLTEGNENQAFGLRGRGWTLLKQEKFTDAAAQFAELVRKLPAHPLAPECAYYRGEALQSAGQLPAAADAFREAFTKYSPPAPVQPGSEQQQPVLYPFRAGWQRARVLKLSQQLDQADRAYAELLEQFPQPTALDRILDEWALLNYEAERFERSDELFRRLIREVPQSPLADQATLSLAESDLLAERMDAAADSFAALANKSTASAEIRERARYQLLIIAVDRQDWPLVATRASEFVDQFPQSSQAGFAQFCGLESRLMTARPTGGDLESLLSDLMAFRDGLQTKQMPVADWQERLPVLIAETQYRLKQYPEALATLTSLRANQPKTLAAYQADEVMGRVYKQQAAFDDARQALERVVSHPLARGTETAAKAQFLIGETYFLQENWPAAFLAYQKVYAAHRHPAWQAPALLQSAKCDEQRGKVAEAKRTYQQLINEFPASPHVVDARQRLTALGGG